MSLVFCFMCFILGAIYFYFRLGDYHTLTENSVLLSAPDNHAPVLFEWVEGELLKQWGFQKSGQRSMEPCSLTKWPNRLA